MAVYRNKMFDKEEVNRLRAAQNYTGLVNYLKQFRYDNIQEQLAINDAIKKFQIEGNRYKGLMSHSTEEEQQAISFMFSLNSGQFNKTYVGNDGQEHENPWVKQYVDYINNLGGRDKDFISIKFDNNKMTRNRFGLDFLSADQEFEEDGYTLFKRINKFDDDDIEKLGISVDKDNNIISFAKSNPNAHKIFLSLKDVDTHHSNGNYFNPVDDGYDNKLRYQIAAHDNWGDTAKLGNNENDTYNSKEGFYRPDKNYTYDNITTPALAMGIGAGLNQSSIAGLPLGLAKGVTTGIIAGAKAAYSIQDINGLILKAQSIVDKHIRKTEENNSSYSNITLFDDSTPDLALLNNLRVKGAIDSQLYNDLTRVVKEKLINNLQGEFTRKGQIVYSNYGLDDEENYLRKVDGKELEDVRSMIQERVAAGDNKYTVSYGTKDGKVGAYITLPYNSNEKSLMPKLFGQEKTLKVFIEGFYTNNLASKLENDPKMKAARELHEMKVYNYDKEIPGEGTLNIIDPINNVGKLIKPDGTKELIEGDMLQRKIYKSIVYDDLVDSMSRMFYDEDGNIKDFYNINTTLDNSSTSLLSTLCPEDFARYGEALLKYDKDPKVLNSFDEDTKAGVNRLIAARGNLREYVRNKLNVDDYMEKMLKL